MSDLHPQNYRDLLTYHASLKQFLSTSTAAAKSNPARAAKARDKLLKLSPSQFFELSTDVYDELQRRIDEASAEPDFLLPRSTFHPKRNEAREKLGLLQQARFRDLVSDILYEIERRNYHNEKPVEKKESPFTGVFEATATGLGISQQQNAGSPELKNERSDGGILSVQQSTVIPTKANLAWSSDEEEETPKDSGIHVPSRLGEKKTAEQVNHISNPASVTHSHHSKSNSTASILSPRSRYSNGSEKDIVTELSNPTNKLKHQSGSGVNRGLSVSKGRNKDREIELLLEEGTKMDQTITELEQKNLVLQSKLEDLEREIKDLSLSNSNLKDQLFSMDRDVESKNDQIKKLHDQINTPSSISTDGLGNMNPEELKKEVLELRARLEDYKTRKIEEVLGLNSITADQLTFETLLSKNGLIPISLLQSFRQLVQTFLMELGTISKTQDTHGDLLFDLISKISSVATDIASFASNTEKAEMVRASISHAITSTRYFVIYGETFPRLVIESAITEVVFTLYDFIKDVRLNKNEVNSGEAKARHADVVLSNRSFSSQKNSTIQHSFSEFDKNDDIDTTRVSPVRPLRMVKRTDKPLKVESSTVNTNDDGINAGLRNAFQPEEDTTDRESTKADKKTTIASTKPSGLASLVSRYSPERPSSSPTNDKAPALRKSSSSNFLSKVKQFEQQGEKPQTPSPSSKKPFLSPLQDPVPNQFGRRSSSLEQLGKVIETPNKIKDSFDDAVRDLQTAPDLDHSIGSLDKGLNGAIQAEKQINLTQETVPAELAVTNMMKVDKNVSQFAEEELNLDVANLKKAIDTDGKSKPFEGLAPSSTLEATIGATPFANEQDVIPVNGTGAKALGSKELNEGGVDQPHDLPFLEGIDSHAKVSKIGEIQDLPEQHEPTETMSTSDKYNSLISAASQTGTDFELLKRRSLNDGLTRIPSNHSLNNDQLIDEQRSERAHVNDEDLNQMSTNFVDTPENGNSVITQNERVDNSQLLRSREKPHTGDDSVSREKTLAGDDSVSRGKTHAGDESEEYEEYSEEEFDIEDFDIDNPENTLSELLLYLEHQTVNVISTIQALLTSIKTTDSTNGELRKGSKAINDVVSQMVEATSVSMNQSRNAALKAHGSWVVDTLANAGRRMRDLTERDADQGRDDDDYADKQFKQRLAGIAFDVAKCTKELVKTVEEANLKEEIEHLNKKLVK